MKYTRASPKGYLFNLLFHITGEIIPISSMSETELRTLSSQTLNKILFKRKSCDIFKEIKLHYKSDSKSSSPWLIYINILHILAILLYRNSQRYTCVESLLKREDWHFQKERKLHNVIVQWSHTKTFLSSPLLSHSLHPSFSFYDFLPSEVGLLNFYT